MHHTFTHFGLPAGCINGVLSIPHVRDMVQPPIGYCGPALGGFGCVP